MAAGGASYTELMNICVWVKPNAGMGSLYRSQHELIAVFKSGRRSHRNNIQLGKFGRSRSNVWNYPGFSQGHFTSVYVPHILAPDLVKAAIEGRLPHGMGVARLCDMPAQWSRQRQMLGLPGQ
jgi:hypothetical protein